MLIRLCHCPSIVLPYGFRIQLPLAWLSLTFFLLGVPFASIDCVVFPLPLTSSFFCHRVRITFNVRFFNVQPRYLLPFPCRVATVTMTPISPSLFPPTGSFQSLSSKHPNQWLFGGPADWRTNRLYISPSVPLKREKVRECRRKHSEKEKRRKENNLVPPDLFHLSFLNSPYPLSVGLSHFSPSTTHLFKSTRLTF